MLVLSSKENPTFGIVARMD